MGKLLLLFLLVPAAELAVLIEIGGYIGTIPTLLLLAATAVLGALLARKQGIEVLRAAQNTMRRGDLPAGSIADGILILFAAALLVTPGVLTDVLGLLLLVPAFRNRVKATLWRRFRRAVDDNRIRVHVAGIGHPPFDPESYPIEIEDPPTYKIH
ncbi:MAG: FxsA family protein [Vicinamibacteria bacterium]